MQYHSTKPDIYHVFEVHGNDKSGYYISWRNKGEDHKSFIGSNGNVRHWKKRELAERHADRLRDGISKMSTA